MHVRASLWSRRCEHDLPRHRRTSQGNLLSDEAPDREPKDVDLFEVHGVKDADALGNEPLFDLKNNIIGRATAGYYGHALRKSLGLGYIKPEFAAVGSDIEIEILGERKRATVLIDSPYDPENKDLRA